MSSQALKLFLVVTAFSLLTIPLLVEARTLQVTEEEYGAKWPFTVPRGELEWKINAVIMHTGRETYSINGTAMGRYEGKYPTFREIAKPYPGFENDPQMKMFPSHELIKRGLELCGK